jgi:hypothetical protein
MASKSFELRVKIVEIGETQEVGQNGFKKREVVGMIEGEYPDYYKFEFIKSKVDVPDELIEGTYATVFFNIAGRKVDGKKKGDDPRYFSSLQAWKVEAG